MKREMEEYGLPEPEFYEERGSFKVIFRNNIAKKSDSQSDTQGDTQSDTQNKLSETERIVLEMCIIPKTAEEIRKEIGKSSKSYVARKIIKPLVEKCLLDYTNKNSINAKNQKYITINK